MAQRLEERIQRATKDTIIFLAKKAETACKPSPSIRFAKIDVPQYDGRELLLPMSYSECTGERKAFRYGISAGLVMLYHQNEDLRPLIRTGGFFREKLSDNEFARYKFWSHLAMTYSGLVCLMHKHGAHCANQQAEVCRCAVEEAPSDDKAEYAAFVGINYAAQVFLKKRDSWLAGVLEMHRIHEIHELVVNNEYFAHAITKDWD
ncbi:MAG: hypothetical protein QXK08_03235 [Candidatus Woesearchaeota archaeon]